MVYIPSSTYRLQLSPKFKLKDVRKQLAYLDELGISTIYAAPFFKAKTGSEHGYDVAEAHQIGPEIGTMEEFEQLTQELKKHNMGWLQDIVPNHMAFHPENVWLMDVLEKGQKSDYFNFFDINFSHPDFKGKVMVPFLGEPLNDILDQQQLKITLTEKGFLLNYFDNVYPASLPVYTELLDQLLYQSSQDEFHDELQEKVNHLKQIAASDKIVMPLWDQIKSNLFKSIEEHQKKDMQQVLDAINNDKQKLQELLEMQFYTLCHWQETEKRINYRRFFTVNELICLSMEKQDVFDKYHEFIKQLCDQNLVQGLRVDHVDGLFDPDTYLEHLRALAGEDMYLVVEKILEGEENLPENWPIQGNSGYDFLAWVSNLYTDSTGEKKLTQLYKKLVPRAAADYEKLVFEKKMFILKDQMPGELDNLYRLLQETDLLTSEYDETQWKSALGVLLASFPVYRIYAREFPLSELANEVIEEAFKEAHKRAPEAKGQFKHFRSLFEVSDQDSEKRQQDKLYFVMRSQQFTGPLAAKGVEDTTFYNYNRLLSLNEVGNSPELFNLRRRDFHELMQYKLETYPHSINATATHDTKRGEGSRMRLEVLSELPDEWEESVQRCIEIVRKNVPTDKPTPNDLYFMLQTLVGVMPINGEIEDTLVERVQEYLIKAFREAKVNTSWTTPNEDYENAVIDLVKRLLQEDKEFIEAFMPFFRKTSHYGWLYSLCQTMLKVACPGVPDIYQGCELWDFSLVDPDNRRPVDYEQRQQFLDQIKQQEEKDVAQLHEQLLSDPTEGQVKLYLIYKVLNLRRQSKELFDSGSYIPLTVTGKHKNNLIAFARKQGEEWCLVVVPRLLAQVVEQGELPIGQVWQDTAITLPADAPTQWKNLFGVEHVEGPSALAASDILASFPVALLTATKV